MKRITLQNLALEISNRERISVWKAKRIVNCILDIWLGQLIKGGEIYLRRLGKIYVRWVKWHLHDKGNRFNPFDNKHRRGISKAPEIRFSKHLKRVIK